MRQIQPVELLPIAVGMSMLPGDWAKGFHPAEYVRWFNELNKGHGIPTIPISISLVDANMGESQHITKLTNYIYYYINYYSYIIYIYIIVCIIYISYISICTNNNTII